MNSLLRALALLATLALASACVTSTVPVGTSQGGPIDMRLVGMWKGELENGGPDKNFYLFIFPGRDETGLEAAYRNLDRNDWESFRLITGTTGDVTFANFQPIAADGHEPPPPDGYAPFVYRFQPNGSVRLFGESERAREVVSDAIAKGSLAGENSGESSRITADPATLDAFFAHVGPMFWNKFLATLRPLK